MSTKEEKDLLLSQRTFKANLAISAYAMGADGNRLTYDEALSLLNNAIDSREVLGPFDPAFPFIVRQVSIFGKVADAIAWVDKLDRKDHLKEYQVIWSFAKGSVTEQGGIWISKGERHESCVMGELKRVIREKCLLEGIERRLLDDLEVIFA